MGNLKNICSECDGVGTIEVPTITGKDQYGNNIIIRETITCPYCGGDGYVDYGNAEELDSLIEKCDYVVDKVDKILDKRKDILRKLD